MKTTMQRSLKVLAAGAVVAALGLAATAQADGLAENDGLNGTLWLQTSVEFKANALSVYQAWVVTQYKYGADPDNANEVLSWRTCGKAD